VIVSRYIQSLLGARISIAGFLFDNFAFARYLCRQLTFPWWLPLVASALDLRLVGDNFTLRAHIFAIHKLFWPASLPSTCVSLVITSHFVLIFAIHKLFWPASLLSTCVFLLAIINKIFFIYIYLYIIACQLTCLAGIFG
jgi:hypothetical protein